LSSFNAWNKFGVVFGSSQNHITSAHKLCSQRLSRDHLNHVDQVTSIFFHL